MCKYEQKWIDLKYATLISLTLTFEDKQIWKKINTIQTRKMQMERNKA